MSLFGPSSSSAFGTPQPAQATSPFSLNAGLKKPNALTLAPPLATGTSNQQQATSNPFTSVSQGNPFGGLGTSNPATQPQQAISIFGSAQPQQQLGGGIFGQQQQQQPPSLFGGLNQPQQQQQPQQSSSTFGTSNQQPQQNSMFGIPNQQQPQLGSTNIFGQLGAGTNQPQPQAQQNPFSGSLFSTTNQTSQQQQQQGLHHGGSITQNQTKLWQDSESLPRPRSVISQIETAASKWNPLSLDTLFQTYLYNAVSPDQAPFYAPGPQDDEVKWEEALRKRPSPGSIPVIVRGFSQLRSRMETQWGCLQILQGRLHEINNGLTDLLRKHDLQISARATECRRKHLQLNHQCLSLAAKVQVLRNRGYAMDGAEEMLREKILRLEKNVFDPALNGRAEEIWARMVSVRERGRQIQRESEKLGKTLGQDQGLEIDEEVMKRASKILEDYNSQLSHLTKELAQIQKDFAEWEQPTPAINGSLR